MRVLLIEDNPGDARLVQEILKEAPGNFTISVAEKLGPGLKLLLSQDVDVVLLDLNLPDSHGLVTLTELQTRFPHLPIVVMTSINDEELAHQAVRLGAQDYLVKGNVQGELLRRTLAYAIDRKQAEEALRKAHDELEVRIEERTKELQEAKNSLQEINATLEQRVAERTAELQAANEALRTSRLASLNLMEDAVDTRKRAERTSADLARAFAQLRIALDAASAGTWEWDLGTGENVWSEETWKLYGLTPDSVTPSYDAWQRAIHPDDRRQVEHALQEAARRGTELEVEWRVQDHQNSPRWLMARGKPVCDADGRFTRFIGIVVDISERKRVEEAITRAKDEWERTFDSVPDLIAIHDNQHRIVRVNKAMAQRLALPPEECVGLFCYQCVHGLSAPHDLCPHALTLQDGAQHIEEVHEERLAGDFLVSTTPLYDSGGAMIGSVHVARDITERKQVEEFAKALITIGNMIHTTLDFDTIMKLALAEASRALRCETAVVSLRRQDLWVVSCSYGFPEEIVGSAMSDEQEPHAVLAITTKQPVAINDAYADDRVNLDHMKKYGVRAVLAAPLLIEDETAGVLCFNYHKSPVAFSRIQIDFTRQLGLSLSLALQNSRLFQNQRRAEQSLQKANRRLAVLSETAGALLASEKPQELVNELCGRVMEYLDCHAFFNFLVDEQAGRLRLNACAGIPAEEARRIEWLDYCIAVCGCAARDNCRIVAEHIPTTPDERTVLVKSYGIKAYACHPLLGSGGKVIGTLSFGTRNRETFSEEDLSLMKAVADQVAVAMSRMGTELALLQRSEELQAANRDLEAFIYSVSHDLRTPMRSMAVFTKRIADSYADRLDDKGRDYFRRVRDAGVRMNRLVEDLLYLSRVSRQEIKRTTFDLSGMASHLVAELRESSPGRNVEVDIEEDISVFADPQLIQLVMANILGNAWKFTSKTDKARISFGGREGKGALAYCVSDNGAGFDPEYAGKMFHPFQRLHSDDEFEGTGIGLAIVEQAIRRHGGKVWAEGNIGKGATIFFTLADPGKC